MFVLIALNVEGRETLTLRAKRRIYIPSMIVLTLYALAGMWANSLFDREDNLFSRFYFIPLPFTPNPNGVSTTIIVTMFFLYFFVWFFGLSIFQNGNLGSLHTKTRSALKLGAHRIGEALTHLYS